MNEIKRASESLIASQGSYSTFRTLFAAIDTDSNGVITKQELKVKLDVEEAALAAARPTGTITRRRADEAVQLAGLIAKVHAFEQIVANHDVEITLAEFVGALHVWD